MEEFNPMDGFRLDNEELTDESTIDTSYLQEEEEEEEQSASPSPTATATQPEQSTQQSSTEGKTEQKRDQQSIYEEGFDLGDAARATSQQAVAAQVGLIDFGTDLVNIIPGVNIPKIPKFENDVAEAGRNISSVLIPTIFGGMALKGAGAAAHGRVGWNLGNSKFVQWVGKTGLDTLAGVGVDAVSRQSLDDNLTGTLKKQFPATWDWIPDSWATLDSDSPDQKRQKNIQEGAGLGLLTSLAEGVGVAVNAFKGARRTVRTYGESAQSTAWLRENAEVDVATTKAKNIYNNRPAAEGVDVDQRTQWDDLDPEQQEGILKTYEEEGMIGDRPEKIFNFLNNQPGIEYNRQWSELSQEEQARWVEFYRKEGFLGDEVQETIENAILKQEESLDEIGVSNIANGADPEQPIRGVDDLFEHTESGSRTVDNLGIVGASIDNVRIAKNYDTVYGRLGNAISEPAMDYAGQGASNTMEVVTGLARQLDDAGPVAQSGKNWTVSAEDAVKQGDITAALMFEPGMTVDELRRIVDPMMMTNEAGAVVLSEDGYKGVVKALGMYREELAGSTLARAQALATTSVAGQTSDMAESARLMTGSPAREQLENRILENMKFLMTSKNVSSYYLRRKRAALNYFSRGFKSAEKFQEITAQEVDGVLEQITRDTDKFFKNAQIIRETNPEAFDNLLLAYELTDGNIDSMHKLSKYIDDSVTNLGKGIIDLNPQVDNLLISGIWANIYNSVLSGIGTPISAIAGNVGGLVAKPLTLFGGAVINQDLKTLQRSWLAYSAIGDTLGKALKYSGSVFRKASQDPDAVRGITRTDLVMARQEKMQLIKNVAASEAAKGNTGLQQYVRVIEFIDDAARNPWLRLGPNALTAVDGLTSAFIANANSRFMALDELAKMGKKATRADIKAIADKRYAEMFDSNGLITDKATKWASDEIALNLNSPIATGVQDASKYIPAIKPFMMFQTTGVNMTEMMGKYAPIPIAFQRDINDLAFTSLQKLLSNEAKVDELLTVRGYDVSNMDSMSKANRIAEIQAETKGRKAIGALAVTGAIGLIMNDRMTGDGLYDKEAQRVRTKLTGWKPRSIKGPDGKWYSYESLGPIADWLAAVANVSDNFDMVGETVVDNMFNKLTFVMGAAVFDRSAVSSLEPLFDMLNGNGAAAQRWSSGFLNSIGPLASARNDFGKILSEGLREVDSEFTSFLQNRNLYTEHLSPDNRLPYVYNPLDGKVANSYGLLQRLWNATSPIKVHDGQSEEQEFLTAMEYDLNTTFKTRNGVALTPDERSELFRIMGEDGYFKNEVKLIMKDAKDWKTLESLRAKRRSFVGTDKLDSMKWQSIGLRLRQAQNDAEKLAFAQMDPAMREAIDARILQKNLQDEANREGEIAETLNIRK